MVRDKIRVEIDGYSHLKLSLQQLVDKIHAALDPFATSTIALLRPARLKVMIIYEVFTYDPAGTIQTPNPQSANAQP
jgi:hypothetical protein